MILRIRLGRDIRESAFVIPCLEDLLARGDKRSFLSKQP